MRKLSLLLAAALLSLCLGGCWDYRGLDELSMVAGIALDRSETIPGGYRVSFEIVDPSASVQNSQSQTQVVETEGRTLQEAIYEANKRLIGMLYLGNTELLIISEDLAREGLTPLLEECARDPDVRDEIIVVLSRAESAAQLITPQKESMIISYELVKNLTQKDITTNPTDTMRMYQIINSIKRETSGMTLPAYNYRNVGETNRPVLDGLGAFREDRLECYIEDSQVPLYQYLNTYTEGTIYSFGLEGEEHPTLSGHVRFASQKKSFRFEEDKLKVDIRVKMQVQMYRLNMELGPMNATTSGRLEDRLSQAAKGDMERLIRRTQEEYGLDVFQIATMIYRKDPRRWEQIKDDWEEVYRGAEINVTVDVKMIDAGWMLDY